MDTLLLSLASSGWALDKSYGAGNSWTTGEWILAWIFVLIPSWMLSRHLWDKFLRMKR
jgi:hypothetical protein